MDNSTTAAVRVADAVRGAVYGAAFGAFSAYWAFYLINDRNWGDTRSASLWATPSVAFRDAQDGMLVAAGWGLLIGALYWLVSLYVGLRAIGWPCDAWRVRRMDVIRCGLFGAIAGPIFGAIGTAGVYHALDVYAISLGFWGVTSAALYSLLTTHLIFKRESQRSLSAGHRE